MRREQSLLCSPLTALSSCGTQGLYSPGNTERTGCDRPGLLSGEDAAPLRRSVSATVDVSVTSSCKVAVLSRRAEHGKRRCAQHCTSSGSGTLPRHPPTHRANSRRRHFRIKRVFCVRVRDGGVRVFDARRRVAAAARRSVASAVGLFAVVGDVCVDFGVGRPNADHGRSVARRWTQRGRSNC